MPRAMVHPRLKRILSETASPTPDRQSDTGKLEPESEEQDPESEDKGVESTGEREPDVPAESQSSMEISDGDVDVEKLNDLAVDEAVHDGRPPSWPHEDSDHVEGTHGDETPPASQTTPRATRAAKSVRAASPASQATKETSPAPPSTSVSANRSPIPQAQPRLKIKLKLGARPKPPQESTKVTRRRTGKGKGKGKGKAKADPALTFTLPPRTHTEPSEASSHVSAESEDADDADAESEDEPGVSVARVDDAHSMDVDPGVPADEVEDSEGDLDVPDDDMDDSEVRSGSRGRLTARQAVLASMVGADHVELAPTSSRKKNLTSEEIALRREETARKRKNMSEKKLEDEKTETINRLLKKQSSRSRAKRSALLNSVVPTPQSHSGDEGDSGGEGPASAGAHNMPGPAWRWVSGRTGMRLGIPPEVSPPPPPAPPRTTAPPVCDVTGCAAQRKYRLVQDFQRGACGLEHLRVLNAGLAAR